MHLGDQNLATYLFLQDDQSAPEISQKVGIVIPTLKEGYSQSDKAYRTAPDPTTRYVQLPENFTNGSLRG